jgi:hypothetical protein
MGRPRKLRKKNTFKALGYEGYYEVSNHGRVRGVERTIHNQRRSGTIYQTIMKSKILSNRDCKGYAQVCLYKDGIERYRYVHRLVAGAFIPNPDNLPEVNHMDENPLNNHADNLEWCTHVYNLNYGTVAERIRIASIRHRGKAVIQMDLNGNKIQEFQSIREAAKCMGIAPSAITGVCAGRQKTSCGFIFKFA